MLAGFETPDPAASCSTAQDIAEVLPHQRPVNMMFQSYALFPHLNVRDNIAFGLKRARMPRAEIACPRRRDGRAGEAGGTREAKARPALRRPEAARGAGALAGAPPAVLLLDEPLAALDKKLREETQVELMELQRRLGTDLHHRHP